MKLTALLLAGLWLPATLHCEMESAGVRFLTHDDHHQAEAEHEHDTGTGDEHHAFKDTPYTASASAIKVLPPGDSLSVGLLTLLPTGNDRAGSALSVPRHGPPPEWRVAWQFITRAVPPARAPTLNT